MKYEKYKKSMLVDKWLINGEQIEVWIIEGSLEVRMSKTVHQVDLPANLLIAEAKSSIWNP